MGIGNSTPVKVARLQRLSTYYDSRQAKVRLNRLNFSSGQLKVNSEDFVEF